MRTFEEMKQAMLEDFANATPDQLSALRNEVQSKVKPYPHSYTGPLTQAQIKRGVREMKRIYQNAATIDEQALRDEVGSLLRKWKEDRSSVLFDVIDSQLHRAFYRSGIDIATLSA